MKKIFYNFKENTGSVTLYVLVAILFFIIIIFSSYSSTMNKKIAQDKEFNKIKAEYEKEYNVEGSQLFINVDITKTNPEAAMISNATIIERDASKGIVIQDENKNEWVWIEVPRTEVFKTAKNKTDYENIKIDLSNYIGNYSKGSSTQDCNFTDKWYADDNGTIITGTTEGLTDEQKLLKNGCNLTFYEYKLYYEKMLSSIYNYGGFWISRYEIGDSTATTKNESRTIESGITGIAVSKPDQVPYNYITCSQAQMLAQGMTTDNKTTSLLFGIQWDLVCKYLEVKSELEESDLNKNSISWGNYTNSSLTLNRGKYNTQANSELNLWTKYTINTENYITNLKTSDNKGMLLTTGASEQTQKMNIYDLSGNVWERTLQCTSISNRPCNFRGGAYDNDGGVITTTYTEHGPISFNNYPNVGFRVTIY